MVGEKKDGRELVKYGLGQRNVRGDRLVEFNRENSLVIANTLFEEHKRRRYIWKMSGDLRRFHNDYILVKNRFRNQVRSCKTYPGADCVSDHQLVGMKFCVKFKKIVKAERKSNTTIILKI